MSFHFWGTMIDSAADDPVAAVLSAHVPFSAVAGYVGPRASDNRFVTFPQLSHHFAHRKRCLSIGVHMEYPAEVGDLEAGDMRPQDATEWVRRRRGEGFYKPVLYFPLSSFDAVKANLDDNHVNPFHYRMWPADFRTDLGEAGSRRFATTRLLREEFFGAVQYWSTEAYDLSVIRRDFWPD